MFLGFGVLAWSLLASAPLLQQDFEKNAGGWIAFGPSCSIGVTRDPAIVRNGDASLEFKYDEPRGRPPAAVLPIRQPLDKMRSVRFWIMSPQATAAAMFISEKQGGRYISVFWLEPRTWQRVELVPEDFVLGRQADDPPDPDGRLDLEEIRAFGILDIGPMFAKALGESDFPIAINDRSGSHSIYLDDFEISTETPAWRKARPPLQIDDFSHPQLTWFTLGGADLKRDVTHKVLEADAMQMEYQQLDDRLILVSHPMTSGDFTGAHSLAFEIASDKPAQIAISIEEESGARYDSDVRVPGGNKALHMDIPLNMFEASDNGPRDPDGKLDLDRLRSITLLDFTGAETQEVVVNTLRIGDLRFLKAK